jgi:diguanylate cyclase (GGDEF)-like protein/PAS domain S-box-containing protein
MAELLSHAGRLAPLTGGHRFKLTRYFAVTSLVCILVIAAALGWIFQHLALRELSRQAETHNAELGRTLGNALWHRFEPLLSTDSTPEPEAILREIGERHLREDVIALMAGSKVIKVKLYNPDGLTVFSTDLAQVGTPASSNPGVKAAVSGRVRSDLTHRNSFDGFEGTLQNLDVLATYRPALDAQGNIRGVFEIYTDVSDLVAATRDVRSLVIGAVLALLGILYALLHLLIARAQHILDLQSDELDATIDAVERNNRDLDRRVTTRTAELQTVNEALQREVTDRVAVEGKLRLAAQVFENSVEGITITDPEQRILAVNRAFSVVTGYSEAEVIGQTPRLLQSGRQSPAFYEAMWDTLQATGHWQGEIWNRRKTGEVYPEWLSISAVKDSFGNVSNYVGVFSDISKLKDSQERLEYLAHHDVVTGLPNRLLFNQHVVMAIDAAVRREGRFALIFLDLDHFKNINDSLGHDTGDAFLREIAARLRRGVRTGDTLARLGGDEFITLIEHMRQGEDAAVVAQQMLDTLSTQISVAGHELFVSASIGISLYPDDGSDVHSLVKHAEAAMYQAKATGRNAFRYYEPEMTANASDRLHTEMQLRRALDNGEITLQYQPQIDLATGRLACAEALVRWNHPVRGLVPPPIFIPITEETGLINDIGAWAIRRACEQLLRWDESGFRLPRLAVNVSVRQLERPGFVELVGEILRDTGVAAERLEIEITESLLMQTGDAPNLLQRLRKLGVSLSIDDFGTGFSSLSYLRRLPINKLKIDQSFIGDITTNASDAAIVQSVIALATTMALTTVAEGVESDEQVAFLRRQGCHAVQGYFYSPPLSGEDFVAWAKTQVTRAA